MMNWSEYKSLVCWIHSVYLPYGSIPNDFHNNFKKKKKITNDLKLSDQDFFINHEEIKKVEKYQLAEG